MTKVFGKTNAKVNDIADQSMEALVGLINQNINNPVNDNVNQHIENIQFDIQSFRAKVEKDIQIQGNKFDKKLKETQYLFEEQYDSTQSRLETLQQLISDFEKNNYKKQEQSSEKVIASFDLLNSEIGKNKNTLLEALYIIEKQQITELSELKLMLVKHMEIHTLRVLDELERQYTSLTDQKTDFSKALESVSNQHTNKLETQADLISTQLQNMQQQRLAQQEVGLKSLETQIKNHKNIQMITLGLGVINLFLIAIFLYVGVK